VPELLLGTRNKTAAKDLYGSPVFHDMFFRVARKAVCGITGGVAVRYGSLNGNGIAGERTAFVQILYINQAHTGFSFTTVLVTSS